MEKGNGEGVMEEARSVLQFLCGGWNLVASAAHGGAERWRRLAGSPRPRRPFWEADLPGRPKVRRLAAGSLHRAFLRTAIRLCGGIKLDVQQSKYRVAS